jgi:hypothetical protein
MKKILMTLCLMVSLVNLYAKVPQWVTRRPADDTKYIGIGVAPVSDPYHRNIATTNALLDIANQISVNIQSSSFMQTLDVDGRSKELFEEKVKASVVADVSGHQLKGTYQSKTHYYVYYELDKKKYEKSVADQKKKGIELGLDYYTKGRAAEASHAYVNAVKLYAQGLEAVEPYLHLDLTAKVDGRRVDLPTELYNACIGVFSGFELVPNLTEVNVEAYKPCPDPLAVCLSKAGEVVPNIAMKASFTTGEGALTADTKTDITGTAVFYVTNVTSKEAIQTVEVKIDDSFLADLPESYKALIDTAMLPKMTFTLVLVSPDYTAFFDVLRNDIDACEKQIRSILVNNNFDLSSDNNADFYVSLSTVYEEGGKVAGELYDMKECFTSLTLRIYDNKTRVEVMNYNLPQIRLLVPASNSVEQAKAMCARELMKRANVQLPQALKKMNINQ